VTATISRDEFSVWSRYIYEVCGIFLDESKGYLVENVQRIRALSGTATDLSSPVYLRFKEQLAAVRSATPQCRFIRLLGRKADESIFVFVDSEPASSKDSSPAGQVYNEAPQGCRRVFGTRTAAAEGPYTDRWGKWVSALVPIIDPQTAMHGLATPEDARAMVRKALDFSGRTAADVSSRK
jgi:hypothetical protein